MTIAKKITDELESKGMFPEQAQEVLERAKNHPLFEPMKNRLNDDVSGYPAPVIVMTMMNVDEVALEYIEEKIPQAWFKPMFQ